MIKQFSKQEFFIGSYSVIFLTLKIGWIGLLLSVLCGVLWMLGGTYNKAIRRIGVPLSVWIASLTVVGNPDVILIIPLGFLVLSIGDGFPDHKIPTGDDGSWLGRLVEKIIPDPKIGGLVTKILIPLLLQFVWVPVWML